MTTASKKKHTGEFLQASMKKPSTEFVAFSGDHTALTVPRPLTAASPAGADTLCHLASLGERGYGAS